MNLRCNRCHRPMRGTTAYDGACECNGLIEAARCSWVLGAHQCKRAPGHVGFHLCVPLARALELMTEEERSQSPDSQGKTAPEGS